MKKTRVRLVGSSGSWTELEVEIVDYDQRIVTSGDVRRIFTYDGELRPVPHFVEQVNERRDDYVLRGHEAEVVSRL